MAQRTRGTRTGEFDDAAAAAVQAGRHLEALVRQIEVMAAGCPGLSAEPVERTRFADGGDTLARVRVALRTHELTVRIELGARGSELCAWRHDAESGRGGFIRRSAGIIVDERGFSVHGVTDRFGADRIAVDLLGLIRRASSELDQPG